MKNLQIQMGKQRPKEIHRMTSFVIVERQLWPQPPKDAKPYFCYINTLQFYLNKVCVWEQEIPESDIDKNLDHYFWPELRHDEHFGWILSCKISHKKAKMAIPAIYRTVMGDKMLH